MDTRLEGLLAHAAELERRDEEVAGAISRLADLAARVGALRRRATAVAAALEAIPGELAANDEARTAATGAEHVAALELRAAEERVASLERARRRHVDELDQARRELARARDDLVDARGRAQRVAGRRDELVDEERALRAEVDDLTVEARELADDLAATPRLPVLGGAAAGLAGIETWGGHVRGALLVARGGLDTERERLVAEANTLGASVLGEPVGASSVALVRRRLEEALRPGTRP